MESLSMQAESLPLERLEHFLLRAEHVLACLEQYLPELPAAFDWENVRALRWHKTQGRGYLQPIQHLSKLRLADLQQIDSQKAAVIRNTEQFLRAKPANNVLMTGARGTGKSSLLKALLNDYADQGLRLIEVDKQDLTALSEIVQAIHHRPERYILYCDDLSFDEGEPGYKALKSLLDGSLSVATDNLLIYATSNRRHLMPEYFQENLQAKYQPSGEIHPGEAVEERVSLSDRFGNTLHTRRFRPANGLAGALRRCKASAGSMTRLRFAPCTASRNPRSQIRYLRVRRVYGYPFTFLQRKNI